MPAQQQPPVTQKCISRSRKKLLILLSAFSGWLLAVIKEKRYLGSDMNIADEIVVQKVKQGILSIDKDAEIILFGSRARGDAREDSDWDFLFLTDEKVDFAFREKVIGKIFHVELDEDAVVQVVTKNKTDWATRYVDSPLYRNIEDEGVKL